MFYLLRRCLNLNFFECLYAYNIERIYSRIYIHNKNEIIRFRDGRIRFFFLLRGFCRVLELTLDNDLEMSRRGAVRLRERDLYKYIGLD